VGQDLHKLHNFTQYIEKWLRAALSDHRKYKKGNGSITALIWAPSLKL